MSKPELRRNILAVLRLALPIFILFSLAPVYTPGQMGTSGAPAQSQYEQYNLEAKLYLTSLADAQVMYFVKSNQWAGYSDSSGVFKALGWEPPATTHYAYYCGNDTMLPKKIDYPYDYPDPKKNWPYSLYPESELSDFVCMAVGNNDQDAFPDVWFIDKFKTPVHALDDASNQILVNIVSEPFDVKYYFTKMYESRDPNGIGRVHIEINLPAYRADLYEDGRFLKSYPIAIGMPRYKTPLRDFYIQQVEWNPWWIPPDAPWTRKVDENGEKKREKPKAPGPGNPLGPVKMVLQNAILLHGTNKPTSIGRPASHSCMRMQSDNAVDLAWKVMVLAGTKQPLMKRDLYRDKSRRTYIISLLTNVQVTTIYRRMEVYDNNFLLHTDPYYYQPLTPGDIKDALSDFGIPVNSLAESPDSFFSTKLKKSLFIPIKM